MPPAVGNLVLAALRTANYHPFSCAMFFPHPFVMPMDLAALTSQLLFSGYLHPPTWNMCLPATSNVKNGAHIGILWVHTGLSRLAARFKRHPKLSVSLQIQTESLKLHQQHSTVTTTRRLIGSVWLYLCISEIILHIYPNAWRFQAETFRTANADSLPSRTATGYGLETSGVSSTGTQWTHWPIESLCHCLHEQVNHDTYRLLPGTWLRKLDATYHHEGCSMPVRLKLLDKSLRKYLLENEWSLFHLYSLTLQTNQTLEARSPWKDGPTPQKRMTWLYFECTGTMEWHLHVNTKLFTTRETWTSLSYRIKADKRSARYILKCSNGFTFHHCLY